MKIEEFNLSDEMKTRYYYYKQCAEEIKELEKSIKDLEHYEEEIKKRENDEEELEILNDGIKIYTHNLNKLKKRYEEVNIVKFFVFPLTEIENVSLMFVNIFLDDNFKLRYDNKTTYIENSDQSKVYRVYDNDDFDINYLEYTSSYNDESFSLLENFIREMIEYRIDRNIYEIDENFCVNYLKEYILKTAEFMHFSSKFKQKLSIVDNFINYKLEGKDKMDCYPKSKVR